MNKVWMLVALTALFCGCDGFSEKKKDEVRYRMAPITRTDLVRTVEATGTITPRNTKSGIPVGAQVNGKVIKLFVDYNSVVTNGQVVALIDPLVYEANYKSALGQLSVNEANVAVRTAAVKSAKAAYDLAEKTFQRKDALRKKYLCSQAEHDAARESFDRAAADLESAEAGLLSAQAAVKQSEASVSKTKADLDYCTIRSPVDGVVIARKVEEGETVVSSYNAVPVLTIAEDLKTVWVEATIPEADIGNVREGQVVTFTADAYRRKFTGFVKQIRKFATTTNNVVTYPVIIEAENPDEMLFPGMTATLSIETARAENALVVSSAAFRFRPKPEDMPEGDLPKGRKIWLLKDGKPVVRVVNDGLTDGAFTELIEAEDLDGLEAVVGYETSSGPKPAGQTNPFAPKFPRGGTKGTAPEPKK